MATFREADHGYGIYRPGLSTAGIFLGRKSESGEINVAAFIYKICNEVSLPFPYSFPSSVDGSAIPARGPFPASFIVLSSCKGYVLCRDTENMKYFMMRPDQITVYIPDTVRNHDISTPAVLWFDEELDTFTVICAIHIEDNNVCSEYSFDIFQTGQWQVDEEVYSYPVVMGRIRLDTGVASRGRAYWMTEGPSFQCFKYDPDTDVRDCIDVGLPRFGQYSSIKIQLGKIQDDVCMVAIADSHGMFFRLYEESPWESSWMKVEEVEDITKYVDNLNIIPFRFEGQKLELVLCVGGTKFYVVQSSEIDWLGFRIVPLQDSEEFLHSDRYDIEHAVPFTPC